MNFGNFLFGATGKAMRFFIGELTLGAHYNSLNLNRDGGNGYEPQLDSEDDQNSIENGYIHARDNNYEDIEYKVEIGPLEYDFGIE